MLKGPIIDMSAIRGTSPRGPEAVPVFGGKGFTGSEAVFRILARPPGLRLSIGDHELQFSSADRACHQPVSGWSWTMPDADRDQLAATACLLYIRKS